MSKPSLASAKVIRPNVFAHRTVMATFAIMFVSYAVAGDVTPKAAGESAAPVYKTPAKPGDRVGAGYVPPRLAIGQPDLQGIWTGASNTQLTRPAHFHSLTMTEEEARHAAATNSWNIRLKNDDNQKLSDGLLDGRDLSVGRGYNSFWLDPGDSYANVKGTWRTSWIVDPANGQVPYSEVGKQHAGRFHRGNGYDNPEERPLGERCLTWSGTGPPILNSGYNGNYRIVQSADNVVIAAEGMHDARIIRLNAKHQPDVIRPFFGDSIGWWEGDTLVVETVNINQEQSEEGGVRLSTTGKVIERFTRYSDDQILYEFEINDPAYYTQVWKGEVALYPTKGDIYEVACHEGNYGLRDILAGGRANDRKGIPNVREPDNYGAEIPGAQSAQAE